MTVETKLQFNHEMITQFSQQAGEPDWMLQLRLKGLELHEQLPLPKVEKTKIDNWNIDGFIPFKQHDAVTSIDALPEEAQTLLQGNENEEKAVLVQKDASVIFTSIPESLKKQGVVFSSLQSALTTHPELVQQYFMRQEVKVDSHKIAALHAAAWSGGVFLYVPKNVNVEVPIQALFCASESEAGLFPHVLIIAERHSSVSYTDAYVSLGDGRAVQNGITQIHVGEGAKARINSIRTLAEQVTDFIYRHATVEKDGRVEWVLGEMNDGNTVTENMTHLLGDGASSDSKVITIATGSQRENVVSRAVHTGKHTDSQVLIKGVTKDESAAILNGITFIEKGAIRANGEQTERLLMLSPEARGDANPILLIDEDDVTAGHAASAGQLNPMEIFYLMSRGLSRLEAQRLIIDGFVAPVVDELENGLKKHLEQTIERKVSK